MPPESTATVVPARRGAHLAAEQRGDADRAGALDDELAALHQHDHRLGGLVLADDHDVVGVARRAAASVSSPGRLTAMPSAIVSAERGGHRLAAPQRLRVRRAGGGLHADDLDVRAARP